MLCWSSTYLVVVLLAALFGFINIAASIAGAAKVLSFIFLGLFFAALIIGEATAKK